MIIRFEKNMSLLIFSDFDDFRHFIKIKIIDLYEFCDIAIESQ